MRSLRLFRQTTFMYRSLAVQNTLRIMEHFGALTALRQGKLSTSAILRARQHCNGGTIVEDLDALWPWMQEKFPDTGYFDIDIAEGTYPQNLAAFVVSSPWVDWKKHAVYALHGELYLSHLQSAKNNMEKLAYQDHMAGALMHRANGLMHMAKYGKGQSELELPCWHEAKSLEAIASLAVSDLRQTCTLRSEKYGKRSTSRTILKSYQASLRNLAEALRIHARITGQDAKLAEWLSARAEGLSLSKSAALLKACDEGGDLSASDQQAVERDLRLAENAASAVPAPGGGKSVLYCVGCKDTTADRVGFSCRCQCLCRVCVAKAGQRIQECPMCGDFTEFVPFC